MRNQETCNGCGKAMLDSVEFKVPRPGGQLAFGGYRCTHCERVSFRALPSGPEITELEWLMGQKRRELRL